MVFSPKSAGKKDKGNRCVGMIFLCVNKFTAGNVDPFSSREKVIKRMVSLFNRDGISRVRIGRVSFTSRKMNE